VNGLKNNTEYFRQLTLIICSLSMQAAHFCDLAFCKYGLFVSASSVVLTQHIASMQLIFGIGYILKVFEAVVVLIAINVIGLHVCWTSTDEGEHNQSVNIVQGRLVVFTEIYRKVLVFPSCANWFSDKPPLVSDPAKIADLVQTLVSKYISPFFRLFDKIIFDHIRLLFDYGYEASDPYVIRLSSLLYRICSIMQYEREYECQKQ
jgi:hypothetical protein